MDEQPTWDWSAVKDDVDDAPASSANPEPTPTSAQTPHEPATHAGSTAPKPEPSLREEPSPGPSQPRQQRQRRYGPRSCRICLETEYPQFPYPSTTLGFSTSSSRPVYKNDDPELGRLLSPCKCKGSQKYVHEGCLDAWRLANPNATRNYWQCPTCKFTYKMSRLHWAAMISHTATQVALTAFVLVISLFVLGFIADPIFDLWFDPLGTIVDGVGNVLSDIEATREPLYNEPPSTWSEHFAKGFFSLGLVGFVKTILAAPWQWFYYRSPMGGAGRRRGTGRARAENMNWVYIAIGAATFLMAVWRFVKKLSARVLKNVSDRVMDVGEDDGDDGDDDDNDVNDDESKKDQ